MKKIQKWLFPLVLLIVWAVLVIYNPGTQGRILLTVLLVVAAGATLALGKLKKTD